MLALPVAAVGARDHGSRSLRSATHSSRCRWTPTWRPGSVSVRRVAWWSAAEGGDRIAVRPIGPPRPTLVVAGCDPALPLLETPLALLDPPLAFAWWPCGSREALRLAAAGMVHAAGVHRRPAGGPRRGRDPRRRRDGRVHLMARGPGRPRRDPGIRGLDDVASRGLRMVNREPGAQARALLDQERLRLRLDPADSRLRRPAVGHLQVAATVVGGVADAGVSSEPAALAYGLNFVPLAEERFDLVIPARHAGSARSRAS